MAAQSYPKTSFDAPIDTPNTNIIGTCNLLEALRIAESKAVIHVCVSSEVFGKIPPKLKPAEGIHEGCPFYPDSPYAISKIGTDLVGRYYAEAYGMTIMTTRMFTHTGPRRGDVFHKSIFAKQIAMLEERLIPPVVKVGNLDSLRTYADVRDAVRAYYMLVTVNPIPGEYYNISGKYTCTVGDTLHTLIEMSSKKDEIRVKEDQERLHPIDADLIFDVDFQRLVNFHKSKKAAVTPLAHPNDHPYDSGIIQADNSDRVTGWLVKEEKRKWYHNCVNAGIHVISPALLEAMDKPKKINLDCEILICCRKVMI